jgi:hypothetical protein
VPLHRPNRFFFLFLFFFLHPYTGSLPIFTHFFQVLFNPPVSNQRDTSLCATVTFAVAKSCFNCFSPRPDHLRHILHSQAARLTHPGCWSTGCLFHS